jgi:hypothetical protein
MSERAFRSNQVDPFLKKLRNTAEFSIQQASIRGDADKLMCVRGFFVWMELKKDGEDPDPLQRYKASLVREAGGITIVAKPANWDDVSLFLKMLDDGIYDRAKLAKLNREENNV